METLGLLKTVSDIESGLGKGIENAADRIDNATQEKRDLTELSRKLAKKIEKDNRVTFKEPEALRAHVKQLKSTLGEGIEEWESFVQGKTEFVSQATLDSVKDDLFYAKELNGIDIERDTAKITKLLQQRKMLIEGLQRMHQAIDRMLSSMHRIARRG